MQIHQLKPKNKRKTKKRTGRGGKRGTYSGRGIKGQKSRAGRKMQPSIRELTKRYHKLKGYRRNPQTSEQIVRLDMLEQSFNSGDKITPDFLLKKGLIGKMKRRRLQVRILSRGDLSKKLIVEDCKVSKAAREKIEKANGQVKEKVKNN